MLQQQVVANLESEDRHVPGWPSQENVFGKVWDGLKPLNKKGSQKRSREVKDQKNHPNASHQLVVSLFFSLMFCWASLFCSTGMAEYRKLSEANWFCPKQLVEQTDKDYVFGHHGKKGTQPEVEAIDPRPI